MRSPESFDEFYASSRDRLLHEAYALTGDVAAARTAVRDAFAVAWHHWRKVAVLDDQELWLRPVAHGRARRRATARLWHRDKDLDPEVRATLDALGELSTNQRHLLVLHTLSDLSPRQISRVVGVTPAEADRQFALAFDKFVDKRETTPDEVEALLDALATPVADVTWPRAPIVRRAGTARRRVHTGAGALLAAATVFVAGTVVTTGAGAQPTSLHGEKPAPGVTLSTPTTEAADLADLEEDRLLGRDQVVRLGPDLTWRQGGTMPREQAATLPCQRETLADAQATGTLTRNFNARPKGNKQGGAHVVASEAIERSTDTAMAEQAFVLTRNWYAGCADDRTQLISTHSVTGVGDQAVRFRLRTWGGAPSMLDVAIARTGTLVVTTLVRSKETQVPSGASLLTLAAAVNRLCGSEDAGTCSGQPQGREVPPLSIGTPPGLLSDIDLPPVTSARGSWVGPDAKRLVNDNSAATSCDRATFREDGLKRPLIRTFVFPETPGATRFGLSQVVANAQPERAREFVQMVRERIRECGEANLGTTVEPLTSREGKDEELHAWALEVEVSDSQSFRFLMTIMRNRNTVSQVGFTPVDDMTMTREDFLAVSERAMQRLTNLRTYSG